MSRTTLWRILEVQEASQRESLKGLDNTAADDVDGFEALHKILDELKEDGGEQGVVCANVHKAERGQVILEDGLSR